ncbi:MAG: alpha/beta hydrolase [Gemmatimonadaceae bacterium]
MSHDDVNEERRRFLGAAVLTGAALMSVGAAELGATDFSHVARNIRVRSKHMPDPIGPIKQIKAGVLEVGYVDAGFATSPVVILLHGWPYDIHSFDEVVPLLTKAGFRVIVPFVRGFGSTRFLSSATPRNGQQAVLAVDTIALMDALGIQRAILAGFDWGARTANIAAALWPERTSGLVSVSGYLIGNREQNLVPLEPAAELSWWYQYYFATARGRNGYAKYRREFARLIWQQASPQWKFDDATFNRSAASFENPDHADVVVHNYRWRLSVAAGEAQYDELERKLATAPGISVPTVTLEGDANGAPHPDATTYAAKFTSHYKHRVITGGIGHNLPQEAPQSFAQAIEEVAV